MLLTMELVFILFVMDSHCCGIETQLIFVCSSYDLQICSVCLLLQPVDLWWILFYIYSYAICDTVLLPPFSFGCLYIPCFLYICSGQTYWIAVVKMGMLNKMGFVPSPLGKLTVFNIDYVVICGVFIGYLYNVEDVPVYSHFLSVFIMTGC